MRRTFIKKLSLQKTSSNGQTMNSINLTDLENDLAHLVSCVPIILESPGSLAELGALVNKPELFQKIHIYIKKDHQKPSYIYLGPVKKLKDEDKEREKVFPYSKGMEDELVIKICENIRENTKPRHKTETLKHEYKAHQMLLACEFVNLLSIARVSEIKFLFDEFQIKDSDTKEEVALGTIRKYLKLCEKVGLLRTEAFKEVFYIANLENLRFASFYFRPDSPRGKKDILRWKAKIRKKIKEHNSYRTSFFAKKAGLLEAS